ncbi:MAG: hypothetical protein A4E36_00478 [Methanoregulaceae archaeon PtaB.Bin009]|nr:MAG: hypothetical protein A4E36_00478 [Methanoregulaceae archaeon PtaB.Bin009]
MARLTCALTTPGRAERAVSIVSTQVAQTMPPTFRVACSKTTSYPASLTARSMSESVACAGSYSTRAVSVPKLTSARSAFPTVASDFSMFAAHVAQCIPDIFNSRLFFS